MHNYNINFQANYIKPVTIKELYKKTYLPHNVSFIEVTKDDSKAIQNVVNNWNACYTDYIYRDLINIGDINETNTTNIFAITEQKSNFNKLEPNKVLALIDIANNNFADFIKVNFLQVKPKYISKKYNVKSILAKLILYLFNKNRKYKNIGETLIKEIHNKFPQKDIKLLPANEAIGFYKKMGFYYNIQDCELMQLDRVKTNID